MQASRKSTKSPHSVRTQPPPGGYFNRVPQTVIRNLDPLELVLWIHLQDIIGWKSYWSRCITVQEIADRAGLKYDMTRELLASLIEQELVKRQKCGRGYRYAVIRPTGDVGKADSRLSENEEKADSELTGSQPTKQDQLTGSQPTNRESENPRNSASDGAGSAEAATERELVLSTGGEYKLPPLTSTFGISDGRAPALAGGGQPPPSLDPGEREAPSADDEPLPPEELRRRFTQFIAELDAKADDHRIGSLKQDRNGNGKHIRALEARRRRDKYGGLN